MDYNELISKPEYCTPIYKFERTRAKCKKLAPCGELYGPHLYRNTQDGLLFASWSPPIMLRENHDHLYTGEYIGRHYDAIVYYTPLHILNAQRLAPRDGALRPKGSAYLNLLWRCCLQLINYLYTFNILPWQNIEI
jgi:hypothetical protein